MASFLINVNFNLDITVKYFNAASIILSLFLNTVFAATAHAKENQLPVEKNWELVISGLLIWTPEFTGSDEYEIIGGPSIESYLNLSEQSTLFANNSGIGLDYQLSDNLNTGILGKVRSDQDRSKIKNLDGLLNIDEAFEVGSYLSYQLTDQWEINISGLFDVSDTHDGWVANLNVSHEYMIPNTPITITTLAGLDYANKNYNNTYFGVKPSTNGTSTQSSFVLGSGFNSATFGTTFSYVSSDNTTLIGLISATQIIGDAKNSPIIKESTLITVGLGVAYSF
jgi:outer membrane protein